MSAHFFFGHKHIGGIIPCSPTEVYAFILHPEPNPRRIPDDEKPAILKELMRDFGGVYGAWFGTGSAPDSSILQRPFEYAFQPRPWHVGRAIIIGDAAHATTPHLASGAGIAVEDALVLTEELARAGGNIIAALEAFTDRRYDRCKFVVDTSVGIAARQLEDAPPEEIGDAHGPGHAASRGADLMTDQISNCGHERRPIPVQARGRELIVDIHCHLNIAAADALIRAEIPNPPNPLPGSPLSNQVNARLFAAIGPKLNGVDQRIADMDALGVDVQAISPSPGQYYYFAPPELGRDAARVVNDGMAAAVATHPDRLVGMGTVPLQNVEMAVAEMRRCVSELDLRGIEISSNVNGRELAEDDFRPFWAAAEELGVLVFMHPLGFTHGQRLTEHYLNNIIGNPIESTIAVSHLIFGGVLDAHPGLKLCVAHGGGYLPGYWGRMDHA